MPHIPPIKDRYPKSIIRSLDDKAVRIGLGNTQRNTHIRIASFYHEVHEEHKVRNL